MKHLLIALILIISSTLAFPGCITRPDGTQEFDINTFERLLNSALTTYERIEDIREEGQEPDPTDSNQMEDRVDEIEDYLAILERLGWLSDLKEDNKLVAEAEEFVIQYRKVNPDLPDEEI